MGRHRNSSTSTDQRSEAAPRRPRRFRLWLAAALAVPLFVAAPARAQTGDFQCMVATSGNIVGIGEIIHFQAWAFPENAAEPTTYHWDFGDGTSSNEQNPSHTYDGQGNWFWTLTVTRGGVTCTQNGEAVPHQVAENLAASASYTPGPPPVTVSLSASGPASEVCMAGLFQHQFTPHNSSNLVGRVYGESASFTLTEPGVYDWRCDGYEWYDQSTCLLMSRSATIAVFPPEACLEVGDLELCADKIQHSPDTNLYALSGNVNINGKLLFDSDVTYEGDPATDSGKIRTDGQVQVKLQKGTETILKGPGLSFNINGDVEGAEGTLAPTLPEPKISDLLPIPVHFLDGTPMTLGEEGVRLEPTLFLGGPLFAIVSFKSSVLLVPGGPKRLEGFELAVGQIGGGVNFVGVNGQYDYDRNLLTLTVEVGWPYGNQHGLLLGLYIRPDCYWKIDGGEVKYSLPKGIPIPSTPLSLEAGGFKVANFCKGRYWVSIGADFSIFGIDDETFVFSDVGVRYQHPSYLIIDAGTCKLLGYPLGALGGRVSNKPGYRGINFKGWVNIADVIEGNVNAVLNLSKLVALGSVWGGMKIPKYTCGWTNFPCRVVKKALTAVGDLPIDLAKATINVYIRKDHDVWTATFRQSCEIGGIPIAAEFDFDANDYSVLIGTNFENMIQIAECSAPITAAGTERSVVFADEKKQAIFAVGSNSPSSPIPAIYLKTPQGQTITPSNAGSFPGVHYSDDDADKVAIFRIESAAPGTWTLGVSNLSESQVTFGALVPHPQPQTAFRSVVKSGNQVSVQAAVSLASDTTKVSFFYTQESPGSGGFPIAEDLPATSGTVGATWDISHLAQGTYTLYAVTDDGFNAPVTTLHATQVTVGSSSLQPPTNLSGTKSGTTVDLTWTPSPSQAVVTYNILYTDRPDLPTYPYVASTTVKDGITIEGLDTSKDYRFVVQGLDISENYSPETAPWYTGSEPPVDVLTLTSGSPTSDSVGAGLLKHYKISVPDPPESLKVFTAAASADVDLYLKYGAKPSQASYDYKADSSAGNESLSITPSSQPWPLKKGDWYIGVYGKQAATFSVGAEVRGGPDCKLQCSAEVPDSAQMGTGVVFSAASTPQGCPDTVTYEWTFGDKTPVATGQSLTHTYTEAGQYTWTLTAISGDTGCVKSGTITVSSGPPCTLTCSATVPIAGSTGSPISFQATATATDCQDPPAFFWNFGDGQTSAQQSPSHAYTSAGTYTWNLSVTAGGAAPCNKTGSVVVALCNAPQILLQPQGLTISSGQSATLAVVAAGTPAPSYQWYKGQRGDTSNPVPGASLASFTTPALTSSSDYWVRLTNPCGHTDSQTARVRVETGCFLSCGAEASPASGKAPLAVSFAANSSPTGCSASAVPAAEAITVLTSGVPATGSVQIGQWVDYKIAVPQGAGQMFIQTSNAAGDIDLYVRMGSQPDFVNYDYKRDTYGGNESLFLSPSSTPKPLQAGDWYIAVYGFKTAATYTITAWVGPGTGIPQLASGAPVQSSVPAGGWKFYLVEIPPGATQLEIKTTEASMDLDLYVRYNALPDVDAWDYRPYLQGGNETVSITPSSSPAPLMGGFWCIGIHNEYTSDGTCKVTASWTGGTACTLDCSTSVPPTGTAGNAVNFSATATPSNCQGSPTFLWSFGDGQTSPQPSPSHVYPNPGTYNWTFTASISGVDCMRSGTITLAAPPISAYSWDFGDGQTSTEQNPTHAYARPGNFVWQMTSIWTGKSCERSGLVSVIGGTPGDCNGDDTVSIGEVQKAINMFLGTIPPDCGVDCNGDGTVSIGEVQKVINAFLGLASSC